ncbi:DUF4234 domain-containing protein [uncultured Brachyspira sp.]|uniref:DUF4234 domain-containing protein n=1 Tax=uncultured Brachyspira sp. TaxID=221953 RepID=UPI0025E063FD|nr:DUF4234 domain-containing protein [uncultured Brachyspira sp.]
MKKGTIKNPIQVVLLSIVTCGIYYYYWLYLTTKEIKEFTENEALDPLKTVLFTIVTCGIFGIYWYYKMSPVVFKELPEKVGAKVEEDKIKTVFILSIFIQVVSCYLMQTKLNEIWEKA